MANTRIGSALPFKGAGANYIEQIDTTGKQLTANDSGKVFLCDQNSTADVLVNLPKLSKTIAGWNARFILRTNSTNAFTIAPFGGVAAGGTSADDDKMYFLKASGPLRGDATHNLGSLADAAGESFDITVTGAALGDLAAVSCLLDAQELTVTANVRAVNTVEVRVQNESGGTLDIASTTFYAYVWDRYRGSSLTDNCAFNENAQVMNEIEMFCDGTYWWGKSTGESPVYSATDG